MALAERAAVVSGDTDRTERPSRRIHVLLLVALVFTFAAQARTLTFYFFQDDYVAFGEIVTHGAGDYTWNLLTLNDLTPNWRVFTGMTYLASYELFGMAAWPTRVVMVVLHLAVVALLYRAVWRITSNAWASFAAAVVFGISPAYAGTLGQLGSVTYMWAGFFLVATLNCCIECALAANARRSMIWLAAAVVLFASVMASNESMAIMFPVFGLAFLLLDGDADLGTRLTRTVFRTLPFAIIGFSTALYFTTCGCTAAEDTFGLENVHRSILIYAGRLVYPVGLEPPSNIDPPHFGFGLALFVACALMLAFGPAIGRIGAVWLLLAIVPHALIETHTAHRFVYLAMPGFALFVGGAVGWMAERFEQQQTAGRRELSSMLVAAAILFAVALPWYAWQTHLQNDAYFAATEDWRALHDDLQRAFPVVESGATVEVIGGPLTHPLDNFYVMPALGYTIWGPDVGLQTIAPDDPYAESVRAGDNRYAAEFDGDLLVLLHPSLP